MPAEVRKDPFWQEVQTDPEEQEAQPSGQGRLTAV
jgi:hypothetical protein